MLPRASWLPGTTSATKEATSSSAGYFPPVPGAPRGEIPAWLTKIPGNVGGALRGFDRSDGNWGALERSVQRLTHAQVPSLESMINRGVQGLGGWVDQRVEGVNRLVARVGEGWDRVTGPITDRINRWAAGEPSVGSGARSSASLESMINRGVQGLGGWVDERVEGVNRLVTRAGEAWDRVTGPLTDRINRWAAGEPSVGSGARGTVGGFLRGAWEGARDRLDQQLAALRQPNSPEFTGRLNTAGGLAASLSLAGNIGYGITGRTGWQDAAGVGTVIGGGVDLVGLRSTVVTAVNSMRGSRVLATVSTVGKVSGVLSAVTGALTMATEIPRVASDLRANGGRLSEQGGIAAVKAVTGLASTVGGLLLLTPAAPVGGVILAASGIVSAGTWIYENRQRLWSGLQAYQGVARNAATIASVVTQRAIAAVQQSPVGRAVQSAASAVSSAASSVRSFLGNVFGGGSQASTSAPRPTPTATPRPVTSTPARPAPQPTRPTPSPSPSRSPSPVRSTPAPSHSSPPRSSPARPATPSRSPSTRFGR